MYQGRHADDFGDNGWEVVQHLMDASWSHPSPPERVEDEVRNKPVWFWFKDTEHAARAIGSFEKAHDLAGGRIVRYESVTPPGEVVFEDDYQIATTCGGPVV